jgi:L-fuculose-phosphate aldolase
MHSDNLMELLKLDVVKGAKACFDKELVQRGEGNISTRVPEMNRFLITPTYNDYERMTANDVVLMDFDGNQLTHQSSASSEYRLHISIYKYRPKVNAVIHTHSPYATMLAVTRKDLPILLEEMIIFAGGIVKCTRFEMANTIKIGDSALEALGINNAALLANHGVLICGRTMEHAIKTAELVEKMAKIYIGAHQLGPVFTVSDESYQHFREKFESLYATHN